MIRNSLTQQVQPAGANTFDRRQQAVDELIRFLNQTLIQGPEIPDANFIAKDLDGQDDQKVRAWVKQNTTRLGWTVKDYEKALRYERIRKDLGAVPHNATELVEALVQRDKMSVLYNGLILNDKVPMLDREGVSDGLTMELLEEEAFFQNPKDENVEEFCRNLRLIADTHKLPAPSERITDAVNQWITISQRHRLQDLFFMIRGPILTKDKARAEALWLDIAHKLFVTTPECPDKFIVAVLKKFMQQVKRKIRGLPVKDHLMPVIVGTQGKGKTTFVQAMLAMIEELVLGVDFKMIEDERNIDIWKSYILFIDEMGYASKANVDTVKNAITAKTLTRRPMRTNTQVTVKQNATFIGCSNKKLAQLIKDPTGIRRFVSLLFSNDPDWTFMNQIDWPLLWASVDHEGDDPIAPFKGLLATAQEDQRERGRVEHWLEEFKPETSDTFKRCLHNGRIQASPLYESFVEFEETYYRGHMKTNITEWGLEMRRLEESGRNERFSWIGKVGGRVLYAFKG
ncbi:VapE domain-containing protein [Methylobacterium terricola]|uniref:VapE domain-containing protein n=1 Tax=Methylobacterium terricola TaxID=2583531 RepID=UPI0014861AB1|nr:VapE domain-containing protein [Methylobacterium terricola]